MLTLALVKKHLRVDHEEEDDLIQQLLDSAVSRCKSYLNRDVFESADALQVAMVQGQELNYPIVLEAHHKQAMLLLVGEFYSCREASGTMKEELPMAVKALLKPDRIRGV